MSSSLPLFPPREIQTLLLCSSVKKEEKVSSSDTPPPPPPSFSLWLTFISILGCFLFTPPLASSGGYPPPFLSPSVPPPPPSLSFDTYRRREAKQEGNIGWTKEKEEEAERLKLSGGGKGGGEGGMALVAGWVGGRRGRKENFFLP